MDNSVLYSRSKNMSVSRELLLQGLSLGAATLYFLLTITGILTLYHFWFQSLRTTKLGNKLPGDAPIPIIGNAWMTLTKNPVEIMKMAISMAERTGKIVRFWFGTKLVVALLDPRDMELILGNSTHLEKSSDYRFFEPWLGDGLLINKGERWRSHRKMIAPTFHQSILKTFLPIFNKNANELVDQLRKEVGKVCDIHDYMSGATVDVLLETVMGVKKTKDSKSSFRYAKAVMDMCSILHVRHYKIHLRLDFIFRLTKLFKDQVGYLKEIHSLTDRVIKDKKQNYFERVKDGNVSLYPNAVRETEVEAETLQINNHVLSFGSALRDDLDVEDEVIGEKKRLAFLDFMVEASQADGNNLNDVDIRDEVNTIMFEGHDTTAAASSFFLCMLGVHPDIQERVYQEIESIFHGQDRPVTFADTLEMKYLERVFLETLRMYPPVPTITRVLQEDLQLVSADYVVPKGTTIVLSQFAVHRDPTYYPNPEKFDPDNFLPERCQQRHYYSFIPFSAGPRSCVGRKYAVLKLKILLAQIIRNFEIKSVVPAEDFQLQGDIILKRADGFGVILTDRRSA